MSRISQKGHIVFYGRNGEINFAWYPDKASAEARARSEFDDEGNYTVIIEGYTAFVGGNNV